MGTHQPIRKIVQPEIPDKLYFRIGDVARLCEVPAYVLRFWETEFPQLKPNKGGTGQRLYRKRDVEMALRIKSLLYDQGYTIPGARQVFKGEAKPKDAVLPAIDPAAPQPAAISLTPAPQAVGSSAQPSVAHLRQLQALRSELQSLHAMLSTRPGEAVLPVKSLRPRLVLEPKLQPAAAKPEASRFQLHQRDLFPE